MSTLTSTTGALILPPFRTDLGLSISYAEYDAKLKFFLTYFDQVCVLPIGIRAIFPISASTELEQYLVHSGAVQAASYSGLRIPGNLDAEYLARFSCRAYELLNENADQDWALSVPEPVSAFLKSPEINSIIAVLDRCLPCPGPMVPIEDVIAFRAANREALEGFKQSLNRLYYSLGRATADEAVEIFEGQLVADLGRIRSAFAGNNIPFFEFGVQVALQFPTAIAASWLETFVVAHGGHHGLGVLAGAVSLKFGQSRLAKRGNSYPADYQYLVTGMREGLLSSIPESEPFTNDIRHLGISASEFPCFYPQHIRQPGQISNVSWKGNSMPIGEPVRPPAGIEFLDLGVFDPGGTEYSSQIHWPLVGRSASEIDQLLNVQARGNGKDRFR